MPGTVDFDRIKRDFEKATKDHVMTVEEHGLLRYLTFRRKDGCSAYHFNITTWPGHLAITGDMRTYVFSRLPDMFDFFRGRNNSIGYITEKLVASDGRGPTEFCQETLKESLVDIVEDYRQLGLYEEEELKDLLNELNWEVGKFDNEFEAVNALLNFEYEFKNGDKTLAFEAEDLPNFTDYVPQYIWCIFAIEWAIKQYDEAKEKNDNRA